MRYLILIAILLAVPAYAQDDASFLSGKDMKVAAEELQQALVNDTTCDGKLLQEKMLNLVATNQGYGIFIKEVGLEDPKWQALAVRTSWDFFTSYFRAAEVLTNRGCVKQARTLYQGVLDAYKDPFFQTYQTRARVGLYDLDSKVSN